MTKYRMLNLMSDLGYFTYYSEFDSYGDVRKEFLFATGEVRRISGKKLLSDLFKRD